MNKFIHKKAVISYKKQITPEIFHLKLKEPFIAKNSLPGQFVHLKIQGKSLRRPLSIFTASKTTFDILFRVCGEGTTILSRKKKGDYVNIIGPLGNGFSKNQKSKKPLFIAGGLGVVPLNFLAGLTKTKGTFVYGVRKNQEFVPLNNYGHKIIKVSEEDDKKTVTDMILPYLRISDTVYAAGPREMLKKISTMCIKNNKDGYISWEERMGCGIGLCNACAVKTKQTYKMTCSDGPVFNIRDIDWDVQ